MWCTRSKHIDNSSPRHQNNVPGLSGPLRASHSSTSADHSYTHTSRAASRNRHTTATETLWVLYKNPTSDHVLLVPYVVKWGGGAQRKATCTLCSLGKSGCHTEETQEDRCSVCLSTSLGWRSWEIKGGVKTVTWTSTCQMHASNQHCIWQTLRVWYHPCFVQ